MLSATPILAATALCPLLGPDFPAPTNLASNDAFQKGLRDFLAQLSNLTSTITSDTAYSVGVTSISSNASLYELHYTPDTVKNASHGVHHVDSESVYRVGSVSKVFTVWTFLVEVGDAHFNDPVTKYVPELRNVSQNSVPKDSTYDDIENVNWDEITLGNLASQLSGIERESTAGDLSVAGFSPAEFTAFGLPILNGSAEPTCGGNIEQPPCDRQQFFHYLLKAHPVFPAAHSPAYSNIAYQLLAYALESLTGKSDLSQMMQDSIFNPLGMSHSSFTVPNSTQYAVIPGGNATATAWNEDLGVDSPGGSVYLSTKDFLAAARSILSSSLLPPAQTRRWLKPLTYSADSRSTVGAPWQIRRLYLANDFPMDIYAKDGKVGLYNSELLLSPAHGVGTTVMSAGANAAAAHDGLDAALANTIFQAVENAAREQATLNYAGKYVDNASNSSVTIAVDAQMGLALNDLLSRGEPSVDLLAQFEGVPGVLRPRLYPTTLKTLSRGNQSQVYTSRTGWRAVYLPPSVVSPGDQFSNACAAWGGVGVPQFGNVGMDEFVFNLDENGRATSLDMRGFRLTLARQE